MTRDETRVVSGEVVCLLCEIANLDGVVLSTPEVIDKKMSNSTIHPERPASSERPASDVQPSRFYASSSSSAFDHSAVSAAPTVLTGGTLDDEGGWAKSASAFDRSGRRPSAFSFSQKFSTSAPAGGSSAAELDEELRDARENIEAMELMQLLQAQEATNGLRHTSLKAVQRHAFAARAQRALEQWRRGVAAACAAEGASAARAAAAEAAEAIAAARSPRRPALAAMLKAEQRPSTARGSR